MKMNKVRAVLATVCICVSLSFGSGITAYANVPDNVDTQDGEGVIVELVDDDAEDSISENEIEDKEDIEDTEDTVSDNGILTPEGNLTLIDDIDGEHSENLQYMTVQTRNGEYFYLIVDRSGTQDNVYFLNAVDEADLISILSEEDQELIDKLKTSQEEEEPVSPIILEDEVKEDEPAVTEQQKKNNPFAMLIVFSVVGAGIAGAYYFFKIKPGKNQIQAGDDLEFYDDEDYINEDEEYDDETGGEENEASEDALDDDFQLIDLDDAGVDPDISSYDD